jgi:hypothetical protein
MSEDQLRAELNIIRELITESNADLSQAIRVANSDTLISVQARNNELKRDVKDMTDGMKDMFKWTMGIILVSFMSFGGWLATDHLSLKAEHKELKNDFGTVLKVTSTAHEDAIGFEEIMDKYFPAK